MGLAVPAAITVAIGRAARAGLLIKGGESIERVAALDTLAFDKTGTLTEGKPRIAHFATFANPALRRKTAGLAAAVERRPRIRSPRPSSASPRSTHAPHRPPRSQTSRSFPASASRAARGRKILLGNASLLLRGTRSGARRSRELAHTTPVYLLLTPAAGCLLRRPTNFAPRQQQTSANYLGIRSLMLTGDTRLSAEAIAREAGIDDVRATCSRAASSKPSASCSRNTIASAWPATASMTPPRSHSPTPASPWPRAPTSRAKPATFFCFTTTSASSQRPSPRRRTVRVMRQNLGWALLYNVIGIPIAAGVLYPHFHILLSPVLASAPWRSVRSACWPTRLRLRRLHPVNSFQLNLNSAGQDSRAHLHPLHSSRSRLLRPARRRAVHLRAVHALPAAAAGARWCAARLAARSACASSATCCPTSSPSPSPWRCSSASCSASAASPPTAKSPPCAPAASASSPSSASSASSPSSLACVGLVNSLYFAPHAAPALLRLEEQTQDLAGLRRGPAARLLRRLQELRSLRAGCPPRRQWHRDLAPRLPRRPHSARDARTSSPRNRPSSQAGTRRARPCGSTCSTAAHATTSPPTIPTSTTSPPSTPPICPSRPSPQEDTHLSRRDTPHAGARAARSLASAGATGGRQHPDIRAATASSSTAASPIPRLPRAHAHRRAARPLLQTRRQMHRLRPHPPARLPLLLALGARRRASPPAKLSRLPRRLGSQRHLHCRRLFCSFSRCRAAASRSICLSQLGHRSRKFFDRLLRQPTAPQPRQRRLRRPASAVFAAPLRSRFPLLLDEYVMRSFLRNFVLVLSAPSSCSSSSSPSSSSSATSSATAPRSSPSATTSSTSFPSSSTSVTPLCSLVAVLITFGALNRPPSSPP